VPGGAVRWSTGRREAGVESRARRRRPRAHRLRRDHPAEHLAHRAGRLRRRRARRRWSLPPSRSLPASRAHERLPRPTRCSTSTGPRPRCCATCAGSPTYDYALDRSMIPLGSCTMKLNATTELEPISWPGSPASHPFAPAEQVLPARRADRRARGPARRDDRLRGRERAAQRRLAGRARRAARDRAYHALERGETQRDVCLIPSSAHGTNAASAVMAGMRVVVVDVTDGRERSTSTTCEAPSAEHSGRVAAIMLTYPSTHGVYESRSPTCARMVHDAGGQVYIDGANLNALLGVAAPGPVRWRRVPPQPAQDVLHPARGRRTGRGPGGCRRAPRRVPAEPPAAPGSRADGPARWGRVGRAVRVCVDPADLLGVHPADGMPRAHPCHPGRGARGQLRRQPPRRALPGAVPRRGGLGRPRVHPRPARDHPHAPG
jgi:hypothetical protein